MNRRICSALMAIGALLCGEATLAADPSPRPNIVFLLADDLGWGDVGFHGSDLATPHIDALASRGVELASHYAQPVCTASRAALLTGRYPMRQGLQAGAIKGWSRFGLPRDERTLAQALQSAGYVTVLIGKWHLGHFAPAYLPLRRGFDHHYGHYNDAIDYFEHTSSGGLDWHRDGEPLREKGYATRLLTAEATRVIARHDLSQPLFLLVAFNAPHMPLQAPEADVARQSHLPTGRRRTYGAMVSVLDEGVGEIVAALGKRGMSDDTLLVFTSDNGANRLQGGDNGALRGGKASLYEGGVRVPSLLVWPGRLAAGTRLREPLHIVDWYPTFAGLAGAPIDQPLAPDGVDLGPFLLGEVAKLPERSLLLNVGYRASALRSGRFKLIRTAVPAGSAPGLEIELYDVVADPGEQTNLSAAEPQRVDRLGAQLDAFGAQAIPAATESPEARRKPSGWKAPAVWGVFPDAKATPGARRREMGAGPLSSSERTQKEP